MISYNIEPPGDHLLMQEWAGDRTALGIGESRGARLARLSERQGVARKIPCTLPALMSLRRPGTTLGAKMSRPSSSSITSDEIPHLAMALPMPAVPAKTSREMSPLASQAVGERGPCRHGGRHPGQGKPPEAG